MILSSHQSTKNYLHPSLYIFLVKAIAMKTFAQNNEILELKETWKSSL